MKCDVSTSLAPSAKAQLTVQLDPPPITIETSCGLSIKVPSEPVADITTWLGVAEAEIRQLAAQLQVDSSTARRRTDTARADSNTARRETFDIVHHLWRAEERATALDGKIFELMAKVEELTCRQNHSDHAK
jgi:hypothetical protein